jgi:orotidine-5'-phosphate decarboxylase
VLTPRQAIQAGADILVIGRPITRAPDPAEAAREILLEIESDD